MSFRIVLAISQALVLIAGFRAGLAELKLGYPENSALKPRKPSELGLLIFSYVGFSWVSWVLKTYELDLAGLAGFQKLMSWV